MTAVHTNKNNNRYRRQSAALRRMCCRPQENVRIKADIFYYFLMCDCSYISAVRHFVIYPQPAIMLFLCKNFVIAV